MRTPRTTIRRKLILAIMLTSTTALALAGTALTIHEVASLRALSRESWRRAPRSWRPIPPRRLCVPRMTGGREPGPRGTRTDPSIMAAALYDEHGGLFRRIHWVPRRLGAGVLRREWGIAWSTPVSS